MMAGGRGPLLALLFLRHFLLTEAFKILILSFIGGSHYLMMDEISQVLHNRGHEVRMLLQTGVLMIPGRKYEQPNTYQITAWSASQDYLKEYEKWFADYTEDFLKGREDLSRYLDFMNHLAYQCHVVLNKSEILNSLKDEKFDITVMDGFNPCSFLVAEKEEELEDFIANSEDGFIIVTLGSMLSSIPLLEVLQEMNTAFAHLSQGVIWRCQHSKWPKELKLASNVKIADWIPQNDLLGHPMARLLVTHGGLNSLMESIYHGVPVVGIPLFGDQHDNMVRVEAKNMGITLQIDQLKADKFTRTMKQVIEDKRYKSAVMSLSTIHHSHPLPPDQRLGRWLEHVLQARGGAHLQPYAFQQSWFQQYLLDVLLFLSGSVLGVIYLCVKLLRTAVFRICSAGKQKQT
ncbi:UDP-glucuronosyltransferase 3A1-like [Malaclemys terrapin pileata]|uniref:UDP-glucuronosyltransferase 3A1-like n=1 Tax=Malaclemys terrapin pileata TaxID=2991368 RepID=UPI0023A7A616|nr:UDP-glucuronosyltransferase 3A1-like [Malaclemys terrapin pileata]